MKDNLKSKRTLHWLWLLGVVIFVAQIIVWWGVPTYQQWQADRLVDDLCGKDGGIKVYEKVTLPSSMFNEYGQPEIPIIGYAKKNKTEQTGLYFKLGYKDIVGHSNSSSTYKLAVWRSVIGLYRNKDEKLLGEAVSYVRSGGDPMGPWHPSSYRCPNDAKGSDLVREVVTLRASN